MEEIKIPEVKLPAQLPQAAPELPAGMIEQIDKYLSNPLFQIAARGHSEDIRKFITENSGEFEPLVYDYIKGKYINIYNILKPEEKDTPESEPEPEDEEEEPIEKPIPRAAVEYEMIELYKEGYNYSEISDHLNSRYDLNLWPMQISRVIARAKEATKAAQSPKPKLQEAPEVKNTLPQATRTQTPAEACTTKPAIDPDMMLVVSSAASLINQWNRIKVYVLMALSATAGYLLK